MALNAKLVDVCDCKCCCCCDTAGVPDNICRCFGDDLVLGEEDKAVLVSLGLFSVIKIERNVQLRIPAIDFCVPTRECISSTEDNPCELFNTLRFPLDEFFPPQRSEFEDTDTGHCR